MFAGLMYFTIKWSFTMFNCFSVKLAVMKVLTKKCLHETSINAGFTKDRENLVCELHVTLKNQLFTHESVNQWHYACLNI